MSFNWWIYRHPHNGLIAIKRNESRRHTNISESQRHYAKRIKPDPKSTYGMIHFFSFWKRQNYRDRKQIHSYQGLGWEKNFNYKGAQRKRVGWWSHFCILIMVVPTWQNASVKTYKTIPYQKGEFCCMSIIPW